MNQLSSKLMIEPVPVSRPNMYNPINMIYSLMVVTGYRYSFWYETVILGILIILTVKLLSVGLRFTLDLLLNW